MPDEDVQGDALSPLQRLAMWLDAMQQLRKLRESGQAESMGTETEVSEPMDSDEALIASTREDLHNAIQSHFNAMYGDGVTTNWVVCAERLDVSDAYGLWLGASRSVTPWLLAGMNRYMHRAIEAITA
jgi:hypothetical protein